MATQKATGKLGLSLAGGGFRASLFHLGVLRRLAELDVLRRVEVLSTVSGGSITGALYVLLLKKYLERARPTEAAASGAPVVALRRDEYVELVGELESILVRGVQKNLRTRLLMNPLGTLLVLLTGDSLGRRMGRLYERYLMRDIVEQLDGLPPAPWWRPRWLWPGQIRMKDLVVKPGGQHITEGLAAYNARQRTVGGSAVTSIAINATSLNSGGRFYFSAVELGDWYLGYFRESEFDRLLARKPLLEMKDDALREICRGKAPPAPRPRRVADRPGKGAGYAWEPGEAARAAALVLRRRGKPSDEAGAPDAWTPLFDVPGFPGELDQVAFGILRPAKLSAWYLRVGRHRDPPVLGGRTAGEHEERLWAALRTADPDVEAYLRDAVRRTPELLDLLSDYLLELYWLRSAESVSHGIEGKWNDVRVGHAVGASACFPPVFPPFLMYGIYDDVRVPRLGLTDGGVYDNMGVTALLDEGCTEIIASDTSGLFHTTPVAAGGQLGLAVRIPDLLMRALGGMQRAELRERRRVSRRLAELADPRDAEPTPLQKEIEAFRAVRALDALVYFHINSPRVEPAEPGATDDAVPALREVGVDALEIASLRTDLDGFGDVEVAALVNHGYDMADRYVRRYAPELVGVDGRAAPPRAPRAFSGPNATAKRARLILRVGSARFFRALKLRTLVAWVFALAATGGLVALAWARRLTVAGVVAGVTAVVRAEIGFLDRILGFAFRGTSPSRSPWLLTGAVAVLLVGLLWAVSRRPRESERHPTRISTARRLATIRKWARALSGNLFWGLLGLPALVAAGSAILAWIAYIFFHLPFMHAVRIPVSTPTARARAGDGDAEAQQAEATWSTRP